MLKLFLVTTVLSLLGFVGVPFLIKLHAFGRVRSATLRGFTSVGSDIYELEPASVPSDDGEVTDRLPSRVEPLDEGDEIFPIEPSSDEADPDSSSDNDVLEPRQRPG